MADDVTQPGPLRGGRQRANHIQVHRIELGLKERQYIETAGTVAAIGTIGAGAGIVIGGIGAGLAGYALYQWLKDGLFADVLSPAWRDENLYIFSEEQKAIYREQNPTLWSQIFDGPAIFWQLLTNPGPPQGQGGQDTE